eukprot:CAMPEP_0170503574 /NCGR_PEP_ID=MMETSP0208-20121228/45221_1 /TAXON_ID=197538 /ORGANISM="Strombidium inclinatum, Strain S3" /LENGTH=154 /DNA_ID=CAMNT_0010783299 /DNA_START=245 /DNA_END=706 /DNA_ORIENTATION=+
MSLSSLGRLELDVDEIGPLHKLGLFALATFQEVELILQRSTRVSLRRNFRVNHNEELVSKAVIGFVELSHVRSTHQKFEAHDTLVYADHRGTHGVHNPGYVRPIHVANHLINGVFRLFVHREVNFITPVQKARTVLRNEDLREFGAVLLHERGN